MTSSSAFHLLDIRIQKWIWEKRWTALRDIQEQSIPLILENNCDLIISAATASGKTEAAFLPICSHLLSHPGSSALYIGPLKALINDQFDRLINLCEHLEISVYPWHGDISRPRKKRFLNDNQGIVLITPESLESLFVNEGHRIPFVFESLHYIVIDELHSFIGNERGKQLQSLLRRIDVSLCRKIRRIGLSATLGEMDLASDFLRPGAGEQVKLIDSTVEGQELKLILKAFQNEYWDAEALAPKQDEPLPTIGAAKIDIARSLFETLRGTTNLVFANSRKNVELYADLLRDICMRENVRNEFYPHHGSLAKSIREHAESEIKDGSKPTTIICTSTLEMGLDIGSAHCVAQVGAPPSVASLRQRLGRSGRRGGPAILYLYIEHQAMSPWLTFPELLRSELFQTIATVRLLLEKWCEPPNSGNLHLSTLIQQILSLIAQNGGMKAEELWNVLCSSGPFEGLTQEHFISLLRTMGDRQLIMQAGDGTLLHAAKGERIVNHYEFYAAFATRAEYRLVANGHTIGTLPLERPVTEKALIIFAGKRWHVLRVDAAKKVIELAPAKGGNPPSFGGESGQVHDRVRCEMFRAYQEQSPPVFLDQSARLRFDEGRFEFDNRKLGTERIVDHDGSTWLFPWSGDRICDTISVLLQTQNLKAQNWGIAIEVEAPRRVVESRIQTLVDSPPYDEIMLAQSVRDKLSQKYDVYLSEQLLCLEYAKAKLDVSGAYSALETLVR